MGHNPKTELVIRKGLVKIYENANVTIVRIDTIGKSGIGLEDYRTIRQRTEPLPHNKSADGAAAPQNKK